MATQVEQLKELRSRVVTAGHSSGSPDVYVERAQGALIWDVEGREYVDFAGGIGVMNIGHCHPKVVAAIKDQAEKFHHTCFMTTPYAALLQAAEKLSQVAPGETAKSALFVTSGAEAVENAVKIARYSTNRPAIIALDNAYHGRTNLTMALTAKVKPYKFGFGPFAPEIYRMPGPYCYRCPFGQTYPACGVCCADHLEDFFKRGVDAEHTAALIAEPVQGEGGFITPPPEYFGKIAKICRDNGVLLIIDEIQSGMGRTGKMFAIEHYGVEPDLMTAAKSLAAGMPISAVVGRKPLMDAIHAWGLGGTYSGNPLGCRAVLAVLEVFEEENILAKAETLGRKLRTRFETFMQQYEIVGDVRGLGPMLALELVKDRETKEPAADKAVAFTQFCLQKGLVILHCGTLGNNIRTLMPVTITDEQLERGLAIMEEALAHVSA